MSIYGLGGLIEKLQAIDAHTTTCRICGEDGFELDDTDEWVLSCTTCAAEVKNHKCGDVPWVLDECANLFEGGWSWAGAEWKQMTSIMRSMAKAIRLADKCGNLRSAKCFGCDDSGITYEVYEVRCDCDAGTGDSND